MPITRRDFLAGAAVAGTGALIGTSACAATRGIPPGIQLWAVQDIMKTDFAGTLRSLARLGYRRIEAAGWYGLTPAQFAKGVRDAGLEAYSAHHGLRDLAENTEDRLAFARDVGVKYVVASSPAPSRPLDPAKSWIYAVRDAMTLADWRSNAEAMNRIGERASAMGMTFAYHNHPAEFTAYEGHLAYHEIARLTDPAKVKLELDLGWVAAAGYDPVEVLGLYGSRIHLLHIKDIATRDRVPGRIADDTTTVPIGQGTLDWPAIFRAVARTRVNGWFVEYEPPFVQPTLLSAEQSIDYLAGIGVTGR